MYDSIFGRGTFAQKLAFVERRYGHAFSFRGVPFWVHTAMHIIAASVLSYLLMQLSVGVHQLAVGALVFFFAFQEFSIHPRWYGQRTVKSVTDFLSWSVPLVALFILHVR